MKVKRAAAARSSARLPKVLLFIMILPPLSISTTVACSGQTVVHLASKLRRRRVFRLHPRRPRRTSCDRSALQHSTKKPSFKKGHTRPVLKNGEIPKELHHLCFGTLCLFPDPSRVDHGCRLQAGLLARLLRSFRLPGFLPSDMMKRTLPYSGGTAPALHRTSLLSFRTCSR